MSTAIVTGASRGLGLALSEGLVRKGWSLVIDGRDGAALAAAAGHLHHLTPNAIVRAVPGDITDASHRRRLVEVAEELGGLELLVNNASTLGPSPLPPTTSFPLDGLRYTLETNVVAPLALIQGSAALLRRRREAADPERHLGRVGRALPGLGRLRIEQGRPRPGERRARGRAASLAGMGGGSGRPAYPDAPKGLPRRGHLRPAGTGVGRTGAPGPHRVRAVLCPPAGGGPGGGRERTMSAAAIADAAARLPTGGPVEKWPADRSDPHAGAPFDLRHFRLPPELEAAAPPEARGTRRDEVRLLVARRQERRPLASSFYRAGRPAGGR